ncbi:MAG: hypothetical protein ACLUDU_12100 [Butyricimonas faecihominis]
MKLLCVFFWGFACPHANSYSATVTLEVKESSLNDVLQEASRQTQCDILYNLSFIRGIVEDLNVVNKDLLNL